MAWADTPLPPACAEPPRLAAAAATVAEGAVEEGALLHLLLEMLLVRSLRSAATAGRWEGEGLEGEGR